MEIGRVVHDVRTTAFTVEIVKPNQVQKVLAVQPRRWVIERTYGWLACCRGLNRDREATPSSTLAFFALVTAMILQTTGARFMKQGLTRRHERIVGTVIDCHVGAGCVR